MEQPKPEQAEVADNEVGQCFLHPLQNKHLSDLQICANVDQPASSPGLQVLVTSSGRMRSYIAYATKLLTVRLHGPHRNTWHAASQCHPGP